MLNLLHIAVVTDYIFKDMIRSGDCTSIENCPFDIAQEYDYAQTAFVDADNSLIIYWNDNIHSDPDFYIEAFTDALDHLDIEYNIKKIVMMDKDVKSKFEGQQY